MSSEIVRSGFDAWTEAGKPFTNHPKETHYRVRFGANLAYLWMKSPAPLGATVTRATLTLQMRGAASGSRVLNVHRVATSWKEGRTHWNNQPDGAGTPVLKTIPAYANGDDIEIDVTAIVQAWANGTPNYGFRFSTDATSTVQIYAMNSTAHPVLSVEWSDRPAQPTDLRPSEAATSLARPHVTFAYLDVSGNTDLAAVQVQVSNSTSFASPSFDSGEVLTTSSGLDLAEGNGLTDGRLAATTLSTNGATVADTRPTTGGPDGGSFFRRTMTTANTSSPMSMPLAGTGTGAVPVLAGESYVGSWYARKSAGGPAIRLDITWYSATGTVVGSTTAGTVSTPGTAWARYAQAWVAPAGAAFARPVLSWTGTATIGQTLDLAMAKFEPGTVPTDFTTRPLFPGLADDQMVYWRVRAKDGAGLWSDWADPVQMSRRLKPTVTLTNLGAGVVYDTTPPIIWSTTGTPVRYRVLVYDRTDLSRPVHDSHEVQSAETTYTIPTGVLRDDREYRIKVRVWDGWNREATPGDNTYAEAQADFYVDKDAAVDPVATLTAAQKDATPWVTITWTRSTTPDAFVLLRDGKVVRRFDDPSDVFVSGSTYRYTSLGARPNWAHVYEVRAIVNDRQSAANPTTTYAVPVEGLWLIDRDREIDVTLWGDEAGTWENEDDASVYAPVGSTKIVRIVSGMRGREGSLSGLLMEGFGKTFASMEADIYAIKSEPSQTVQIVAGDESFEALVGNIRVSPTPKTRAGRVVKEVSFDFWEVGDLPFDANI